MKRVMGDTGSRFHDAATRHLFPKRNSPCAYVRKRDESVWEGAAVLYQENTLPLRRGAAGRILGTSVKAR